MSVCFSSNDLYDAVKHLPVEGIIDHVRSIQMPLGRAFKIRKIDDAKNDAPDRSTRLGRSLVILSNGTIFYTGQRDDVRHGSYYPSVPEGKLIGHGANKLVFRVFDLNTEQYKAIAIPLCKITAQIFLPSMKKESEMTSRVLSPYTLSARYFSRTTQSEKELGYLESELGYGTLQQMVDRDPGFLAKHPRIVGQVREGLDACHRAGIAHLDARKENILLMQTNDGRFMAKLADFGSAQELQSDPFEPENDLEEDRDYLFALEREHLLACRRFLR